ncbi:MAG: polyisoprenoid-binding protein [Devosia sp.]|uniref:YceI family protein n=1 Tax=Devosia sp. TaxID=1871048 RepID=UPI002608C85F|nr:YceI family protein [Devosia sp.]MDB5526997.1 polyisoprenoid-binding protein [Devosia sp.]
MTKALRNWSLAPILAAFLIGPSASSVSAADVAGWTLDPAKSQLGFSGTQIGTKFAGKFNRYDTEIMFDPDHLDASHIAVTVDLGSVVTEDTQRDTALPGKDWFDIAEFPQATFETTAIRKTGTSDYEAVGTLALRGVTKPLTLPFTLQIDGPTAHVTGQVTLVRTDFGVGQGPWASDQWVAFEVDVNLDILATRDDD